MKKAEKNDTDLREMKIQYESVLTEQTNHIKKLVKERELLHLYVQRLEMENASLVTITNDNETVKLLNHTSQSPTTLEVNSIH
jgi:membrane-bound inhibitor of C-type lysozyme